MTELLYIMGIVIIYCQRYMQMHIAAVGLTGIMNSHNYLSPAGVCPGESTGGKSMPHIFMLHPPSLSFFG